jgi:putative transposase
LRYEFGSFEEVYEAVVRFITYYNNRRLHSSLKYMPPNKAYLLIKSGALELEVINV